MTSGSALAPLFGPVSEFDANAAPVLQLSATQSAITPEIETRPLATVFGRFISRLQNISYLRAPA
ncbi:MAG TPA: hypothetical protein VK832_16965 [Burkholderiaceae bacterium]|nr:hypothetical protein [Burkholderiaceae bacterium]